MLPETGFVADSIDEPRSIVSVVEDGSTSWYGGLYPANHRGTRLVSRWRPKSDTTPSPVFLMALSEPGTFIMERKVLRTIADRVEAACVYPTPPAQSSPRRPKRESPTLSGVRPLNARPPGNILVERTVT